MLIDMLIDFLIQAIHSFWQMVSDQVPDPPGWVDQTGFTIGEVMQRAAMLDAWVPISQAAPVIIFMPIAILAGIAIKVTRIVLSFMTFGGGSAA